MKAWFLAGILSLASVSASAACRTPPPPPSSPNGATASREEMLAAQTALKAYNASVTEYTECVRKEGGSEAEVKRAIRQLEQLAGQFNEQLRAFKQKSGAQ